MFYPGLGELDEKKKIIYVPVGTQKTPVGVKCIFYTLRKAKEGPLHLPAIKSHGSVANAVGSPPDCSRHSWTNAWIYSASMKRFKAIRSGFIPPGCVLEPSSLQHRKSLYPQFICRSYYTLRCII